ncbi:MAG: TetR/AcrR family transcriptional regulator [Candidatus Aminicenantales bacterium]
MSREKILHTAQKIFAKKGFKAATTKEIAEKAKINKAMIYYYFKNKEELYLEVLKNFFGKISSSFSDVSSLELNPPEKFKIFISEYIDIISKNRDMPPFILHCFLSGKKQVLNALKEIVVPLYQKAFSLFQEGKENGYFNDLDFKNVSTTVVGGIVFYFVASPLFSLIWDEDPLSEEKIAKKKKELIKLLEQGLVKDEKQSRSKEEK